MKRGLEGGISIDADSGPLRYVLWCCGSSDHTVTCNLEVGKGKNPKIDKLRATFIPKSKVMQGHAEL